MYCKNCGKQLEGNFCAACGTPAGQGDRFCGNCGTPMGVGIHTCPVCGQMTAAPVDLRKSKVAAGLLGIFLGCFGVHNFYLGYTGKAVAQLLITLLTCGVGGFATEIWGLIEGILILTGSIAVDGKGNPLKD